MNEVVSQLLDTVASLQDELQQLRGRVSELEAQQVEMFGCFAARDAELAAAQTKLEELFGDRD